VDVADAAATAAAAVVVRVEGRVREGGRFTPETDAAAAALPVTATVGIIGVERVGVEDGVTDVEPLTDCLALLVRPAVAGDGRCAVPSPRFRLRVSIKQTLPPACRCRFRQANLSPRCPPPPPPTPQKILYSSQPHHNLLFSPLSSFTPVSALHQHLLPPSPAISCPVSLCLSLPLSLSLSRSLYFRRATNNNNKELCNTFLYLLLNGPHTLGYYDVQLLPSWTKPFQFLIHELPALYWNALGIQELASMTELICAVFHPIFSSVLFLIHELRRVSANCKAS